jgi:hypothetical protein
MNNQMISCVHLNLSSKLALESRLRTHHSCKSVDSNSRSVIIYPYSAFTIESSTPTLLKKYLLLKMMNSNMYNRGHPKVNDSLRKFPYFSLDKINLYSLAFVQQALLF